MERAFLFPTLAVGVEGLNPTDTRMTYKLFRAFNQWLAEEWGFAYRDRLYAVPAIPVLDPEAATIELDHVLEQGAKLVVLRPGPANGRSPADPAWDPFWARLQEADVPVAYHAYGGADQYDDAFRLLWQRHGVTDRAYESNLRMAWVGDRPMLDTALALVLGNVFGRFPGLRVLSVELGLCMGARTACTPSTTPVACSIATSAPSGSRSTSGRRRSSAATSGCHRSRRRTSPG